MASFTRAHILKQNQLEYMPALYTTFTIVYIQNSDYAYRMGEETGSNYFILDEHGHIYGQIHGYLDLKDQLRLFDLESQLNSNDELRNSLLLLPKYSVVKVGEFEVRKIVIYGKYTLKFKLCGIPRLFNLYMIDDQTKYLENIKL
jgi:hypothetical protein